MQRLTAALVLAMGVTPCAAQWGLFGVTLDGDVIGIDPPTGARWRVASTGLKVTGAAPILQGSHRLAIATRDAELHKVELATGVVVESHPIIGIPAGHTIRSMRSHFDQNWDEVFRLVVETPETASHIYDLDVNTGQAIHLAVLAVSDVTAIGGTYASLALTRTGHVYVIDDQSFHMNYQTSLWASGGPYVAIAGTCETRGIAIGAGYWIHDPSNPGGSWTVKQHVGYSDIAALVHFERADYANCDSGYGGPERLDIFDFLCFGNRFHRGEPYACDCDVTTGPGLCDIFDFLCFNNAFVSASSCW